MKGRNISENLDCLWKTSQINSVRGEGGRSAIFGQDSTVSESVALWGLSTGPHKGEEEAVENLAAEIRDVQERSGDREECMMKREKRRKESGNLVQLGEKELHLS